MGFNLCKETLYVSTMKILITSDRTGQNGSSCSRGEQVESWQARRQGGGKVKQRKRWGIWCDFHSGHPYSFSVFLHICPFSSFIFSLFVTLFLAPYLCFWWRRDKPSRWRGNNRSLQNTCFFPSINLSRKLFCQPAVLSLLSSAFIFQLPLEICNLPLASCLPLEISCLPPPDNGSSPTQVIACKISSQLLQISKYLVGFSKYPNI